MSACKYNNSASNALLLLDGCGVACKVFVEQGVGGLDVGHEPEESEEKPTEPASESDAEREQAEEEPSYEAHVEAEEVPLVACHQAAAAVYAGISVQLRFIFDKIGHQSIGIALYEAGDEEKKCPEDQVDVPQEHRAHLVGVVAIEGDGESVAEDLGVLVQEPAVGILGSDSNGIDKEYLDKETAAYELLDKLGEDGLDPIASEGHSGLGLQFVIAFHICVI